MFRIISGDNIMEDDTKVFISIDEHHYSIDGDKFMKHVKLVRELWTPNTIIPLDSKVVTTDYLEFLLHYIEEMEKLTKDEINKMLTHKCNESLFYRLLDENESYKKLKELVFNDKYINVTPDGFNDSNKEFQKLTNAMDFLQVDVKFFVKCLTCLFIKNDGTDEMRKDDLPTAFGLDVPTESELEKYDNSTLNETIDYFKNLI